MDSPLPPGDLRQPVMHSLEGGPLPLNTHGVAKTSPHPPFIGKVLSMERVGGRDRERDIVKIVIDTGGVRFVEGQSFGVIPPGWKLNSRGTRVPFGNRLYSIASSRYGDEHDGHTCTLTVVRVVYTDPKSGKKKRGVCSNYLYHVRPGDEIRMTGPCGTIMLLPEDHMSRPIVCVATGTGIAPFRSFWRRLFFDRVPGAEGGYKGKFWLLAGFANPDSQLYGEELDQVVAANPETARVDVALSLTQTTATGQPLYVQDLVEANAGAFLELMLGDSAIFYFCGLKRMYTGVVERLEALGKQRGIDAAARIALLKKEHRWHVETA